MIATTGGSSGKVAEGSGRDRGADDVCDTSSPRADVIFGRRSHMAGKLSNVVLAVPPGATIWRVE